MGERSDLPRLYIVVDPSKSMRCSWCGTFQSHQWQHSKGGTFCSKSCQTAAIASNDPIECLCCCQIVMMVIGFIISIEVGVVISVFFVPVGILMQLEYMQGKKAALKVPKNSRRKYGLDDFSVLKTILKHAECPNCDGNIDLTEIEADRIYRCRYCGATGVVEIVHTHDQ
jgi:hypothetical protein